MVAGAVVAAGVAEAPGVSVVAQGLFGYGRCAARKDASILVLPERQKYDGR